MSTGEESGTQDIGVTPAASVTIDGLAAGGRGVGRREGRVWFVDRSFPGDEVLAIPERARPRFVEARCGEVLHASPERRSAACRFHDRCGGCPWMPIPESSQRNWKKRIVEDALSRIGGLRDLPVEAVRSPGGPLGYRNRVELTLAASPAPGRPIVGFHGDAGELVDIDRCLLQAEPANRVLSTIRDHITRRAGELRPDHGPFRLTIRRSDLTGEILVAIREDERRFPEAEALARRILQEHPVVVGVVRVRARVGRRGGAHLETVAGRAWIDEQVADLRVRLPADSFVQVSAAGAQELSELVVAMSGDLSGQSVLDLYGGVGLYGFALARRGARAVQICEADLAAVRAGRRAARRDDAVEFVHDQVGRFLSRERPRSNIVVANPPRTGMGRIAPRLPATGARALILVSCEPATLARDIASILRRSDYRVTRVVPVDLFPQTAQIEVVALLERGGGSDVGKRAAGDGGQ